MRNSWRGMSFFTLTVAFILGGLLGWGVSRAYTDQQNTNSIPTVGVGGGPTNQFEVENEIELPLNNLLREHGNLAVIHLQAVFDGKDPLPSAQQLDANSQNLANLISGVFGSNAGDQFLPMWKDHINQYINYTEGLKNNDQNTMNTAKDRLYESSTEMGNQLQSLNNNIEGREVTSLMNEHINLTLSIIDAHARGDQENMVSQIKLANDQATKFAIYISEQVNQTNEQNI